MNFLESFARDVQDNVDRLGTDRDLQAYSTEWIRRTADYKYSYNFRWLGVPIIQFPQDMVAMQEVIFAVKPDLIIETGIAHGGSLIFSAAMLELMAACGGSQDARVVGIDIDIRSHNRKVIEAHPMAKRITMLEGSSIDPVILNQVQALTDGRKSVLVCLDSNHTHAHVLAELRAYAPLVSVGSYCVVFDTVVEHMPAEMFADRPWGPGNSPMTAVRQFMTETSDFSVDEDKDHKLLITVAPSGYLKRIR